METWSVEIYDNLVVCLFICRIVAIHSCILLLRVVLQGDGTHLR